MEQQNSTMIPVVEEIARRNNDDVISSLMARDYETCKVRSSKVLEMIQQCLQQQQPPVRRQAQEERGIPTPRRRLRSIPLPLPSSSSCTSSSATTSNHQSTIIDIFNGALSFQCGGGGGRNTRYHQQHSEHDDDEDDVVNVNVLAAVVLYNTGLCHHLQSLEQQHKQHNHQHQSSTMLLQKALHFYSMACNFLTSSGLMTTTTATTTMTDEEDDEAGDHDDDPTITLLLLALMNNMAFIFINFMELDRAWDCLDTMKEEFEFYYTIIENGQEDKDGDVGVVEDNILTDDEFIFFSMNSTLVLARDSFVASPAA